MDIIYILFFAIFGIVLSIGVGIQLSATIDDPVIYILFWMLYLISIITFVNIIMATYYYLNMKNKAGPPGPIGEPGERGDQGQAGLCDANCRDSIGENQILETVKARLKERNQGVEVNFQNAFIKAKIRQMSGSNEFRQLAPYNGPQNLINYLKDIWKIWIDLLFEAGGVKYFEMLGGEMEFDWLKENPYNEMKKYDVFYWGMGKQYRPEIEEKCYKSSDGNTPDIGLDQTGIVIQASKTNIYESLGSNNRDRSRTSVSFWRAKQFTNDGITFYPVGDLAYGPGKDGENVSINRYVGAINMQYPMTGPNRETIIVAGDVRGPVDYELLWTNSLTSPSKIWIWRPIAPRNYISLGDVVSFTSAKPATNDKAPIRCVPKEITKKLPSTRNILWSSVGSAAPISIKLLGYVPVSRNTVGTTANPDNAYNMFRALVGNSLTISDRDLQGSFYYLDESKYDSTKKIGINTSLQEVSIDENKVGKGYLTPPKKDSKYSIMTYVNLKNNATLKHNLSNVKINAQLVPNAISNAYLLQFGSKCLQFKNNKIEKVSCDELKPEQIFSILFTGNAKNQCKIQHYNSQKMLVYKNGNFTLVDKDSTSDLANQLFTMQK